MLGSAMHGTIWLSASDCAVQLISTRRAKPLLLHAVVTCCCYFVLLCLQQLPVQPLVRSGAADSVQGHAASDRAGGQCKMFLTLLIISNDSWFNLSWFVC
jgi:hypothetical protein